MQFVSPRQNAPSPGGARTHHLIASVTAYGSFVTDRIGRGTSFKGALTYYLHDKDTLDTAERVSFVEMGNLVTKDPREAWREMMVTAEAAPQLKARAGVKTSGRKNTQPVYCFSINWHPDDHPSVDHMRETALDCLRFMELTEYQYVIVGHNDTAHPNVHITVNMIHPETGRSYSLSKDQYKLDRWCDSYELRMGVVRSPERRAKFAALDQGLEPPLRVKQPKHFNNPAAKAATANDNTAAKARAKAIQEEFKAYADRLKATQDQAWKRRAAEQRQLWNDYRTARQAVTARHQVQLDKIYKHKRNRHALPLSIQGFRDWQETREWTKLMERLKSEKRRFEYRERTLTGFVGNAIRLIRPGMERSGKGLLPVLFALLVSGEQRRQLLLAKQELAKKALSEKQFGSRKVRADRVRIVRDAQLAALSAAFDIQKQDLQARHDREIAAQKTEWNALSIERKRLWTEWEAEFGARQRQTQRHGSGSSAGTAQAPARPRQSFADKVALKTETGAGRRFARAAEIRGQGRPQSHREVPRGRPARGAAATGFAQTRLQAAAQRGGTESGWQLQAAAAAAQAQDVIIPLALRCLNLAAPAPRHYGAPTPLPCPAPPTRAVCWPIQSAEQAADLPVRKIFWAADLAGCRAIEPGYNGRGSASGRRQTRCIIHALSH